MSKRTVTEQQVIDAMNKHISKNKNDSYHVIFDELFPELPKLGELILCWDDNQDNCKTWCDFNGINNNGKANAIDDEGDEESYDNYRRLTPTERGES
jgi:hypothetical protein